MIGYRRRHSLKEDSQPVKWSRNLIYSLIQYYKSHRNLWDVSSYNYKNRLMRKSTIKEISNQMGIPVNDINDKIHNLRCQFQCINRKRLKMQSYPKNSEDYKVTWEFYDALKFIGTSKTSDSSQNSVEIESPPNDENVNVEIKLEVEDFSVEINEITDDSLQSLNQELYSNSGSSPTYLPQVAASSTPTLTEILTTGGPRELKPEEKFNDYFEDNSKLTDSFNIFGAYVADELRSMNSKAPSLQSQAKRQIQRIILDMNELYDFKFSKENNLSFQPSVPLLTPTNELNPTCS